MLGYNSRSRDFIIHPEDLMPSLVVVGSQWGDEGKGKIVDLLSERMDVCARYNGGNNAGHTIVNGQQSFKFHLIPSGIIYPHIVPVIGAGVVVDLEVLLGEMDGLEQKGIDTKRLLISGNAHLIMPYHKVFDQLSEKRLGKYAIGTTRRGIGPTYADKASRVGIRVQDLLDMKIFKQKLEAALADKNKILTKAYGLEPFSIDAIAEAYAAGAARIRDQIVDTSLYLNQQLDAGKLVLLEGAQGTFLDLDHGTYPFVTSSSPIAGGACTGAGIAPKRIDRVIAVTKAYVTRVGSGPFPTEDTGEDGETLARVGVEFGTTTGRKRRCGWFDAVLLKYATMLNGFDTIALTKLDVLSAFDRLKVCVGYRYEGKTYDTYPPHQTIFHHAEPVYEELPGWKTDISEAQSFEELPRAAQDYVRFIEEAAGVPVGIISVGPRRNQTIIRDHELV
jgi:adenylosuccinate synthase